MFGLHWNFITSVFVRFAEKMWVPRKWRNYSWTHKIYPNTDFNINLGPTVLFTHKNYFAIVFSTINFQFSANKRYLNTALLFTFFSHFVFANAHVNPTMPHWTAHLCPCHCPRRQPTTTKQLRYGGRKWIKKKNVIVYATMPVMFGCLV